MESNNVNDISNNKVNNKINNKEIGQRIRFERENLNLTREEFAEIINLSDYYVGQLERGERQMSLPAMVNIASCLHLSLDYLIFGNTNYICYNVSEAFNNYSNSDRSDNTDNTDNSDNCDNSDYYDYYDNSDNTSNNKESKGNNVLDNIHVKKAELKKAKIEDLGNLLAKCSLKELDLLKKLIKTILPYISG